MKELQGQTSTEEQIAIDEALKKYDMESMVREYIGPMVKIISIIFILWAGYQLYISSIGIMEAIKTRAWTLIFLLVLTFLLYPASKHSRNARRLPTVWDMLCIILSIVSIGYLILMFDTFAREWGGFHRSNYNFLFGGIAIIMVFEASRRVVGRR